MLTKFMALALLVTVVVRLFTRQWKGMGQWFNRFVDVTLIVLAVVYGAQLIVMLSR